LMVKGRKGGNGRREEGRRVEKMIRGGMIN
jgi:hypothetical protein